MQKMLKIDGSIGVPESLQNFHARNFCMILANITTYIKQIMVLFHQQSYYS